MAIDFSKVPCIYWSNVTKMSYLQRRVIVYSLMYYDFDESCISDREYDSISHQLVALMNESTQKEKEETIYWYAMYDFEGSTGFDIPGRLTKEDKDYLTNLARHIHRSWKRNEKKKSGVNFK